MTRTQGDFYEWALCGTAASVQSTCSAGNQTVENSEPPGAKDLGARIPDPQQSLLHIREKKDILGQAEPPESGVTAPLTRPVHRKQMTPYSSASKGQTDQQKRKRPTRSANSSHLTNTIKEAAPQF